MESGASNGGQAQVLGSSSGWCMVRALSSHVRAHGGKSLGVVLHVFWFMWLLMRLLVCGFRMELRKPRDCYLESMKVVMVAAHFLIFAKQSPNSSKGDVWRYVRKECR